MKKRSIPEFERLEARQLPYVSLAGVGVGSIHQPPAEPAAAEDPGPLVVLHPASDVSLPREEPQATGDGLPSHVPGSAADLWPTPPVVGNGALSPATDPSSSHGPPDNAASLQELKGDSLRPKNVEKLFSLAEHGAANEGLPCQEVRAGCPVAKQPERLPLGGHGRLASEELSFREVGGAPLSARQRENALSAAPNRFASDAVSPPEMRGTHPPSRQRREHRSKELDTVFSSLAYNLPSYALSFRLTEGGGLNPRGMERLVSSVGYGPPNTPLPFIGREGGSLNPKEVEELLASLCEALPGLGHPLLRKTRPDEGHRAEDREGVSVPPLYLSVILYRQPGKPLDPTAQQGLDRLCAYAWRSIRNAERAHGERFLYPEDIVQEIYVEWRGLVGPRPEDEALSRLLEDGSEEMKFLRVAVGRVIGRTRYQQKQWIKAIDITAPANRSPAFAKRGEQERVDWEDLWENVVSTLAPQEKQVLELRKQGKTFAEIGSALGVPRQRACETYHGVVARLQKNYPDW